MANPARALLVAVIATLFASTSVKATQHILTNLTRLKPADGEMRRLILDGYARSALFRELVDELQRSNAIVVIQFGQCAKGRFRSCVTNVDGDGRQRHVRVKINTRTTDDRLVATIAHELQHVVEILRDPAVTDARSALGLYRQIGKGRCQEGLSDECETETALRIESRVLQELHEAQDVRVPRVNR